MGKAMRKKVLEEQKREEEERAALKERIKKANVDREAARVKAERDSR